MAKLDKQVAEWTAKGFITADQAVQITQYESSKPRNSWFLYGTWTLGVSVLGMGVISLIAANWHQIPDMLKLALAFLILTMTALFAYSANKSEKNVIYDVSILAIQVFSLATIGLISQVFHSTGHLYQAILFWCLITLPAALTTNYTFVPFLWTGSFLGTFLYWLSLSDLFGDRYNADQIIIFALSPLLTAVFTIFARFARVSEGFLKALQIWVLITAAIGLVIVETWGGLSKNPSQINGSFIIYVLSLLIVSFVSAAKLYSPMQKGLLVSTIVIYMLSLHVPKTWQSTDLILAACTIIELGLLGAFFASQKSRGRFNFLLMLMGARFFILFIQALRGLAMTGFGLILSGILLIALASVWNKRRNQIAQWVERLVQ